MHSMSFSILLSWCGLHLLLTSAPSIVLGALSPEPGVPIKSGLEGKVCMTVERLRRANNASMFYECAPLTKDEMKEFALEEKYLGVWNLRTCPANYEFEEERQKCKDKKVMRRQPIGCDANPLQIGCGVPCPVTTPISVGGACDWISSGLQADKSSNTYFLQCVQQNPGQTCGEWVRQPCAPGTLYDSKNLICVPAYVFQRDSVCGSASRPVCQCAQSAVQNNCPGSAQCQQNVCCITISVQPELQAIQQTPACLGTLSPPSGSCDNCNAFCPNTYAVPVGDCTNCPANTVCESSLNSCCPSNMQTQTIATITISLLCPTGQAASSACGANGACPPSSGCYQGGCCPLTCPPGQQPIGFCSTGSCGQGNCYQDSGSCCQADAVQLPVCQNGVQAVTKCTVDQECASNLRCSNGGCCPMPFCPSGVQATTRCIGSGQSGCGIGMACMDGVCCPLPKCPNGLTALSTCTRSLDCGRMGFECANGGCCSLPQCPNGLPATQRCSGVCPAGFTCVNGGCCALPTCPNTGTLAVSSCVLNGCQAGYECVDGGCCPLPQCPNGALALQRCQMAVGCQPGHVCENGVCCSLPICSIGVVATSACGMANSCPIGYVCEGRGCCPEPMPLCPNGGRAAMRCTRGSECSAGYGCTPLGGCCLLSMDPVCPAQSNAVCQCSSNQGCPSLSTCHQGTCCSAVAAPVYQVPGSNCVASPQCNGFSSSCAQCVQGVCSCTGGAASNGVACLQMTPVVLTMARTGCDQYGSPCKFVLSTARRRPIFAPTGNVTEKPLFFHVTQRRRCVQNATEMVADPDASCLPNEKCINGECHLKLWPGEYGCQRDEECSARCPNTYCEKRKGDQPGVSQCQCRDGFLLYGRCFSTCPKGFHEDGVHCKFDDEEVFWKSSDAQNDLGQLLNENQC